jgi:hypothetical protein
MDLCLRLYLVRPCRTGLYPPERQHFGEGIRKVYKSAICSKGMLSVGPASESNPLTSPRPLTRLKGGYSMGIPSRPCSTIMRGLSKVCSIDSVPT